jgi:anti-sigma factor RsiW
MRPEDMKPDPMAELPAEVKQNMTRHKAPPGLERRIRHMLAQQSTRPKLLDRLRAGFAQWQQVGVGFACGVLVAASVVGVLGTRNEEDKVEQQLISAHVRSLMASHLMDVPSTDQHTVKPWFTGKLDFAPPVVDLAPAGFPLIGGRLDYLQDRPVAALVYQRRGHVINVFVMPAHDARPTSLASAVHNGYQVVEWQKAGMHLWAVSDISRDEMATFAQAMKAAE